MTHVAQRLRAAMTPPERAVWRLLHDGELAALNFRRQAPFGRFILDFVSHTARLVVEIDGGHHSEPKQAQHDARRTTFLASQGYKVLRFWSNDAMRDPDGVWLSIHAAARETPAHARMQRWRKKHAPYLSNEAPASPSMGEAARSAGGGAPASSAGEALEADPSTPNRSPPPAASRLASPIEGEAGAQVCDVKVGED